MKRVVAALLLSVFPCLPIAAHSGHEGAQGEGWLKLSTDLPFDLFGAFLGKASAAQVPRVKEETQMRRGAIRPRRFELNDKAPI